ncbi:hypothetical protein Tco_0316912 [Tanacetum coccineum]
MASGGSDRDAEYALSKLLQMGTVELWRVVCYAEEAFSLTRAAKTRFTNLDIWEFLRSNPLTLGEDFFKAHITEVRFETIAKEEKEHIVKKKIGVILPLDGEFASPKAGGSLIADEYIGVEEVVGDGEALEVGEDELNRVISTLKDGGGEFDGRLNEINLNLTIDT